MNDYISRQAAIEAIKNDALGQVYYSKKEAIECLNAVPAANVRPVVHGKWVKIYEDGEPAIEQHQIGVFCSKCMKIPKDRFTESEFCPNCGADMRGKRNATP